MSGHREKVVALFERRRATPGAPYEADHFWTSSGQAEAEESGLQQLSRLAALQCLHRRVQLEFGICFSLKDREANYSLDRLVERRPRLMCHLETQKLRVEHDRTVDFLDEVSDAEAMLNECPRMKWYFDDVSRPFVRIVPECPRRTSPERRLVNAATAISNTR